MNDRQGRIGGQGRWNDFEAPSLGIGLLSEKLISLLAAVFLIFFPDFLSDPFRTLSFPRPILFLSDIRVFPVPDNR